MVSLPGYARKELEWLMERAQRPTETHEWVNICNIYTDLHRQLKIIILGELFLICLSIPLPDGLDGVLRRVFRSFMSFILWI